MRRRIYQGVLIVVAALVAFACDSSTPTTPTTPAPTVKESFSGTLTQNGTMVFQFTIKAAGTVTATLTALSPSTTPIGLGMGNWLGTACQVVVDTPFATQGTVVTGTAATATAPNLCVRVNDASGTITDPASFTVDVVHP